MKMDSDVDRSNPALLMMTPNAGWRSTKSRPSMMRQYNALPSALYVCTNCPICEVNLCQSAGGTKLGWGGSHLRFWHASQHAPPSITTTIAPA
eukprot:CAMPEP_0185382614 /NCGR_PEP_ID=MMETSP1364-20130426/55651_1 /TAXON_ID=38817 /ORGANISM="Gephyrocapsa oceanica, Strain RCC1303" /LENGTH=92 /DNA_ID=CAMNT_0027984313 /DNA_START=246 /DNA_END=520 /DNA_ORIENTATION=+